MENVLLIIHLILAAALIALVLLQRSEGGALGIGGGGGGGLVSSRGATTAIAKATWVVAAGFILLSLALTVMAAKDSGNQSVLDRLGTMEETADDAPLIDEAEKGLSDDVQNLLTLPQADDAGAPASSSGAAPETQPTAPPAAD